MSIIIELVMFYYQLTMIVFRFSLIIVFQVNTLNWACCVNIVLPFDMYCGDHTIIFDNYL